MTFGIRINPNPRVMCERLWGFWCYQAFVVHEPAPDWCERRIEEGLATAQAQGE